MRQMLRNVHSYRSTTGSWREAREANAPRDDLARSSLDSCLWESQSLSARDMSVNTTRKIRILGFAAVSLSGAVIASAACQCACVSGTVQAICQSTIERSLCASTIHLITPPAIASIAVPQVPSIGMSHCARCQVYDLSAGQYVEKIYANSRAAMTRGMSSRLRSEPRTPPAGTI
jgi:hypothetical protein